MASNNHKIPRLTDLAYRNLSLEDRLNYKYNRTLRRRSIKPAIVDKSLRDYVGIFRNCKRINYKYAKSTVS